MDLLRPRVLRGIRNLVMLVQRPRSDAVIAARPSQFRIVVATLLRIAQYVPGFLHLLKLLRAVCTSHVWVRGSDQSTVGITQLLCAGINGHTQYGVVISCHRLVSPRPLGQYSTAMGIEKMLMCSLLFFVLPCFSHRIILD